MNLNKEHVVCNPNDATKYQSVALKHHLELLQWTKEVPLHVLQHRIFHWQALIGLSPVNTNYERSP